MEKDKKIIKRTNVKFVISIKENRPADKKGKKYVPAKKPLRNLFYSLISDASRTSFLIYFS